MESLSLIESVDSRCTQLVLFLGIFVEGGVD